MWARIATGALGCAILLPVAPAPSSAATPYTFTSIADNTGPYSGPAMAPAMNDQGAVIFRMFLDAGGQGIFTGPNPLTSTVASTAGPYSSFGLQPVINNSGVIAFDAGLDAGGNGIFRGPNPATDTFVDTSGPYANAAGPAINDAGTILFYGTVDGAPSGAGFYKGPNPSTGVVAASAPYGSYVGAGTTPSINNAGAVAFFAQAPDLTTGIFTGANPSTDRFAGPAGPYSGFTTDPVINNNGMIVFHAGLDAGGEGIFKGPNPATDTIVDTLGPFSNFAGGHMDVNDAGLVAFQGSLDAGGGGIYVGPNPVADKVIATGDTLFGSTVTGVDFIRGLNNNGDIAFNYYLSDGRIGVAVASVPEPAGLTLAGVAGAALLTRRPRAIKGGAGATKRGRAQSKGAQSKGTRFVRSRRRGAAGVNRALVAWAAARHDV